MKWTGRGKISGHLWNLISPQKGNYRRLACIIREQSRLRTS
jgi:hypothetical protein